MLPNEYQIMYDFETNYWWYVALHNLIIQKIGKFSDDKEINILDAGCGTGRLMELLQNKYIIEGFDFSTEALDFCKQRGISNVWKQDINTWMSDKMYDVIISADVICSIGIENYNNILQFFFNTLNHNGILILNLPAFEILRRNHDKAVFVAKRFRLKHLKKELKTIGFKIDFATYRLPHLFFVVLFEKWFQKLLKNEKVESDLKSIPNFFNKFFLFVNRIENFLYFCCRNKILGTSVFIIAKKI
jgi:SAM-dependent methyltransferase